MAYHNVYLVNTRNVGLEQRPEAEARVNAVLLLDGRQLSVP